MLTCKSDIKNFAKDINISIRCKLNIYFYILKISPYFLGILSVIILFLKMYLFLCVLKNKIKNKSNKKAYAIIVYAFFIYVINS